MKLIAYLRDVKAELSKVEWPKREEVVKLTLVVLIISATFALYLGGLDLAFTKLIETIL